MFPCQGRCTRDIVGFKHASFLPPASPSLEVVSQRSVLTQLRDGQGLHSPLRRHQHRSCRKTSVPSLHGGYCTLSNPRQHSSATGYPKVLPVQNKRGRIRFAGICVDHGSLRTTPSDTTMKAAAQGCLPEPMCSAWLGLGDENKRSERGT